MFYGISTASTGTINIQGNVLWSKHSGNATAKTL
jgi:hypothetical protein